MQPTTSPLPSVTIGNLTTPEAIQAVIDNPNLVIRNLQIPSRTTNSISQ